MGPRPLTMAALSGACAFFLVTAPHPALACITPLTPAVAQAAVGFALDDALCLASQPPHFEEASGEAVELTAVPPEAPTTWPPRALLDMIASWLGANFDLRGYAEPPRVEFVPAGKLVALRYRGLALEREAYPDGRQVEPLIDAPRIEGLYDNRNRVIYLPDSWQGATVAEISVLVHEMVHHLQNLADVKFSCPDERERLAYKAQDKWLAVFGKSFAEEFDLDPFTLFAKTLCLH